MLNIAMMSTGNGEWGTPQWLFDWLDSVFSFELDACASIANAKCKRFYDKKQDGLAENNHWDVRTFVNPPYGREIGRWCCKAHEEAEEHATVVVCLLPARTDTAWWDEHVHRRARKIVLLRGRIRFEGAPSSAPFPSALAVYRQGRWGEQRYCLIRLDDIRVFTGSKR